MALGTCESVQVEEMLPLRGLMKVKVHPRQLECSRVLSRHTGSGQIERGQADTRWGFAKW